MKTANVMGWTLTLALMFPAGPWAQENLFDRSAAETHFQKGLQYYFQGQYTDAIQEFDESLKVNPDDARSYYFLGYAYYQLRDLEKAQEAFDLAYQANPQYTPIPRATAQP
jgi:tetratricopeptide (TPR) repeat protein